MTLDEFHRYLVGQGYKEYTPSGNPSTATDYYKRIKKVCDDEELTLSDLAKNINTMILNYGVGGIKEEEGKKGHNSVISALKCFKRYIDSLQ